jgi:hypothetical protein
MAAKQGPNVLLFVSNRTRRILFISAMQRVATRTACAPSVPCACWRAPGANADRMQ